KVASKTSSKKHVASHQRSRGKASLASKSSSGKKHVASKSRTGKNLDSKSSSAKKHVYVSSKETRSRSAVAGRKSKATGKGLFASTWNPNKLTKTRAQRRQS
ncbi:MAG: hypothetical protein ACR2J1_07190, partial [Methyloceanibacter sp.]|uniref:hypothetical protein n=1 Tax=Methyloceanibacter sp. TaxID=1965321 RepID=UPI003D9BDA59